MVYKNRSKTYVLPLISDYIKINNATIHNTILNTYIEFNEKEYEGCILLFCKYLTDDEDYEEFEKSIFKSDLYVKHFEYDNKTAYVLKFPEYYLREYNLFKKGKYSEYGDDCKLHIIKYWNRILGKAVSNVPIIKTIKQILYKDPELNAKLSRELNVSINSNQELGEAYNSEKETFNFKMEEINEEG